MPTLHLSLKQTGMREDTGNEKTFTHNSCNISVCLHLLKLMNHN